MATHQIKHRWTDEVLFECAVPDEVQASGMATRFALEKASSARANLAGANLAGAYLARANLAGAYLARANLAGAYLARANLAGAYLDGAYLDGANLDGANLAGAYLDGAYLDGANLAGANLAGAYLDGANLAGAYLARANLAGAYLDGAKLIGERPIFQVGPIGSRMDVLQVFITDQGVRLRAGCFFGTEEQFRAKLQEEHGDNVHAQEYLAALTLAGVHVSLWTPNVEAAEGKATGAAA